MTERTKEAGSLDGRRIEYIDAIRGIASVMVLFDHAIAHWFPEYREWTLSYINLGRIGITAFFVVSGYVVGLTLSKQTIRTFSIRRFWRLYPIYWMCTALYVAAVAMSHPASLEFTAFIVLINITMLQGFLGITSILGPAWTLGVEIAYYVQGVVAKALGVLPRAAWLGYLWLAAYAAMSASNLLAGSDYTALMPLMLYTASVGYAVYVNESSGRRDLLPLLVAGAVVVPLGAIALLTSQNGEIWSPVAFLSSYLIGGGLFVGLHALRRRLMPPSVLWLGAVSYALYLIHITVIELVGLAALPALLSVGLVIGLSILAAGVLHHFVEKPSTSVGRRLTPSLQRLR